MANHIADQMHEAVLAAAELDFKRAKSAHEASGGKKPKKVTPPRPWDRLHPKALCQELELLLLVKEYDYDLTSNRFAEYCERRGVLCGTGERDTPRWDLFVNYETDEDAYLANDYFRYAEATGDTAYRFSDDEMRSQWKSVLLYRARLQDCWEIFKSQA